MENARVREFVTAKSLLWSRLREIHPDQEYGVNGIVVTGRELADMVRQQLARLVEAESN